MGIGGLDSVIGGLTASLMGLATGLCTLVVVIRGLQWMFGRKEEARSGLVSAFWGFGIVLAARWLVQLAHTVVASAVK